MIDLTKLLPQLLRDNRGNPELAVKLAWSRAAGVGLRPHAVPLRLDGRTLIVSVADAIWQKQLEHMCSELLFRLNNLLGKSLVDALVFRIDPSTIVQAQGSMKTPEAKQETRTPAPSELLFAAGTIADEDLRARFMRAAQNCIARRESRAEHEAL